ncbi:PpiC-type peptidyl-prolyl cis-trans isomerase [Chlorobium limicola DSM 245]|uniref:PpiC-type peptidyl-prolyl cis-trans isomerase n=1 Tax=Chlorobium limicola (strain DSM 245 / NBRC 103803 / 6330) TaxID=290315 RepID=B3EEX4_CHLL2|nr:peptidylprolyl isomerase [Chlorobium limicola]ACD89357.1 PpiC-type peptidyl-prolyl cis-trans isomerase [Chlorobium limicola DSM 245]
MAVMTSLRDKTHIILYALLAAFLALIVFEWGMNFSGFSGKKGSAAGKVNGKEVPYARYEEIYKEFSENFRRSNPGADMSPETELGLQEQAWNVLVDQTLLEEQFEKYGISVQDSEIVASLDGDNPPMVIRQNFVDPATGTIDRASLDAARRDLKNKDMWLQIEDIVRRELKVSKLIRALQTMVHVSDRELDAVVKREYTRFSASFISVPLGFAGPDSKFPVKADEIQKYYDSHKELLKQPASRKADYVFFPLVPSAKDSSVVRTELEALRTEFGTTKNDSDYVKVQSDRPSGVNVQYSRADFSPAAGAVVFNSANAKPGSIIGPVADNGYYRLLKVSKVVTGEPVARASHILLQFNPASREDVAKVRERMVEIYRKLQSGESFEALAKQYSQDSGSAVKGGDIGWFGRKSVVPEFAEAVFSSRPGALTRPVQTKFGLHIIKVTGFDQNNLVCSEVVRLIRPSTETVESARRLATAFQMQAKDQGFDKSAISEKLPVAKTGEFGKHTPIAAVGFNDKINAFAFKAAEGDLSEVIETEKGFYVMRLTGKNDTGYRLLDDDLKKRITAELVREKKEAALEKQLASLSAKPGATLETIAAGNKAFSIVKADDIRWTDGYIPGYGIDRPLVEAISGMKSGLLSRPVKTTGGYALVRLDKRVLAGGVDMKEAKAGILPNLLRAKQEQFFAEYFASVRKSAAIEDLRP